ncbi:MAG: hypothetical protein JNM56_40905 [Planctomycetia bacterium]|nr:hypothetical protein [Planctomycetia bacterium]
MYIGDLGAGGLNYLFSEFLDLALDQALANCCRRVCVELLTERSWKLSYDGAGPFDRLATLEALCRYPGPGIELAAQPFPNRRFGMHYPFVAGLAAAFSTSMEVIVIHGGQRRSQRFSQGQPASSACSAPSSEPPGTAISFRPDDAIFDAGAELDCDNLANRFREISYLVPGLELTLIEHRFKSNGPVTRTFRSGVGLPEFLNCRAAERDWVHGEVFGLETAGSEQRFQLAMRWSRQSREDLLLFVNLHPAPFGGTPLEGLRRALTPAIKKYSKIYGVLNNEALTAADCTAGLSAVLSVYVREPMWAGATKAKIVNPELISLVQKAVNKLFPLYLEANPNDAIAIARRALEAFHQRQARKRRT